MRAKILEKQDQTDDLVTKSMEVDPENTDNISHIEQNYTSRTKTTMPQFSTTILSSNRTIHRSDVRTNEQMLKQNQS